MHNINSMAQADHHSAFTQLRGITNSIMHNHDFTPCLTIMCVILMTQYDPTVPSSDNHPTVWPPLEGPRTRSSITVVPEAGNSRGLESGLLTRLCSEPPAPGRATDPGEGCLEYEEGLMSVCSRDQLTQIKSGVEPVDEAPNMSPRSDYTKKMFLTPFLLEASECK